MLRALLLATTVALPAAAEDVALVLAASDYARLPDLPGAERTITAADGLMARGFQIISDVDPNAAARADLVDRFLVGLREADRAVVVMAGRFVTDGSRSWWLGPEARSVTLFGIGPEAVSVETMMRVLATRPGGAVLLLAADDRPGAPVDPWLTEGIGTLTPPAGVTVLRARPEVIASFLAARLAQPGLDLPEAAAATPGLSAYGHLPDGFTFLPAPVTTAPATPTAPVADASEQAAWDVATGLDTIEGYRAYLTRYPRGVHAAEARAALDAILNEPNRAARLAEEALALTRDQRRDVQRQLTVLGYDTRGIDGIFGSGTRTAITNWQQQAGLPQTGYLTGDQLARLAAQAARRQAQIDAEAEAQRLAAEAADRAYWAETGARGDEASLRAYLDRYPEGLNARTARDRLAAIEAARAAAAGDADRLAWEQATRTNTVAAYVDYLRVFPTGARAAEARARRDALLTGVVVPPVVAPAPAPTPAPTPAPAANPAAQAAEEALGLNALTRRLVEQRLDSLRLRPGDVDGRFDATTRAAIARYQSERGLSATGYLDEGTSLRLLADSLQALQ